MFCAWQFLLLQIYINKTMIKDKLLECMQFYKREFEFGVMRHTKKKSANSVVDLKVICQ
jgi:hypothetical protein